MALTALDQLCCEQGGSASLVWRSLHSLESQKTFSGWEWKWLFVCMFWWYYIAVLWYRATTVQGWYAWSIGGSYHPQWLLLSAEILIQEEWWGDKQNGQTLGKIQIKWANQDNCANYHNEGKVLCLHEGFPSPIMCMMLLMHSGQMSSRPR